MHIRILGIRAVARRERRARRWDNVADDQASLASYHEVTYTLLGNFLSEKTRTGLTDSARKHRLAEHSAREMARMIRAGER